LPDRNTPALKEPAICANKNQSPGADFFPSAEEKEFEK
jgi:hypothetical protein